MSEYKFSKTPNATVEQINAAWEGFQSDHATALAEAQAEIARLKGALREVAKASANTGVLAASNCGLIARAALSSTPQG